MKRLSLIFRKNLIIYNLSILLLLFLYTSCEPKSIKTVEGEQSASPTSNQVNKAKVAVLGLFHFGGSSGDLTSMQMDDPFGKRRQDDIKELVTQLSEFNPTKILVEYPKTVEGKLQEQYKKYLSEEDTLKVNEIEQVGFRLAKQFGHTKLFAIDYKLDLPGDGLVEYCQRHNKMNEFEAFIKEIQDYVSRENKILDTMRISSYLSRTNTDSTDSKTNEVYLGNILNWGDSINEAGVNFTTTWWKRNFIILKNIAENIQSEEDRILIIIGSAHRAVLKDLIIDRNDMEYIEIGNYLN